MNNHLVDIAMPKHDYSVHRFLLYKSNVLWKLLPYHYLPLKLMINNADPHSYEAIDSTVLSHKNRRIPRTCRYRKHTLLERTSSSFHRHFSFLLVQASLNKSKY